MARKRPSRSTPLSRTAIIEQARVLLDSDGLDGVSLRRLGTALGVTAPALYAHVRDKDDLLGALADQGYRELLAEFQAVDAADPVDRILTYARVYVAKAIREPALFEVMSRFPPVMVATSEVETPADPATEALLLPMAAIEEAIAEGRIHRDREPLLTSMTLWTCTHGLAKVLTYSHGPDLAMVFDDPDALIADVLGVCVAGMASSPTTP